MIALIFWVPVIWAGGEFTEPGGDESVIGVQLSSKKDEEVDQKEKVKELVEVAGDFIKRRLEKENEAESGDSAPERNVE
jgi:hypothetical protein